MDIHCRDCDMNLAGSPRSRHGTTVSIADMTRRPLINRYSRVEFVLSKFRLTTPLPTTPGNAPDCCMPMQADYLWQHVECLSSGKSEKVRMDTHCRRPELRRLTSLAACVLLTAQIRPLSMDTHFLRLSTSEASRTTLNQHREGQD